jgi:hypothetical protein
MHKLWAIQTIFYKTKLYFNLYTDIPLPESICMNSEYGPYGIRAGIRS